MAIICKKCGCNNIDKSNYCANCGYKLSPSDTYSVYSEKYVEGLRQPIYDLLCKLDSYKTNTQTSSKFSLKLISSEIKNKLKVVKIIKDRCGLELWKAKDLVDGCPSVILTGVDYGTALECKIELEELGAKVLLYNPCSLRLISPGPNKLSVVKILKELNNLDSKMAFDFVKDCPKIIMNDTDFQTALKVKRDLESVGALVDVEQKS